MSQQALTQTSRWEERAATLSSPAPSRRAAGGRKTRTPRLSHTAAARRAAPHVPAPPGESVSRRAEDPASPFSLKAASVYCTDQAEYRYRVDAGKACILFADSSSKDLSIPRAINGAPVTAIAAGAFSDLAALERVSLPNSLTSIGAEAFARCTNLRDVKLGCALESIGE